MSALALPKPDSLKNLGRLQDIPALRQLALLGIVAVAIALGLWLFFFTQKPDYVPVFAGLDPKSTNEASELLMTSQIPFRIDPGTGALAVPVERLSEAKLALASAGLPGNADKGFESMQGDQGFGTSQFVENARYQHALETELARTIANLRPVREARVHLALPKPSAFTRQKEPASASVVLQLKSGQALEQNQVDAIVHLVSSSIPGLPTANVTVVDQFGRMLSNPDPTSEAAIGAKQFDQQRRQEAVYVQRIQELLEPMAGPGRVSAQVSVDMDFNQTEEAREVYGPEASVVRSEQVSEMSTAGGAGAPGAVAQGVPGSVANTPGAPGAAPGAAAPAAAGGPSSRTAVRNFEVDRTLTHTRQAPGRIRRVTAAVLVDNVAGAPGKGKDAKPTTRALTAAELKRIETLVQQAIGFDAQRGDAVSVVNAPFARDELAGAEDAPPIWQDPRAQGLLRTILGGLALLAVILFVIRPTFRQLVAPRSPQRATDTTAELVGDDDVQVSLGAAQAPGLQGPVPGVPQMLSFDDKVEVARQAVATDPKRVANVIKDWVAADGS